MNNDQSHIDQLFKHLDNASVNTDKNEMWSTIEQRLDQKKKKRAIIIWWSGAASVLLVIGFLSGYFFSPTPSQYEGGLAEKTVTQKQVTTDKQLSLENNTTTESVASTTEKQFNAEKPQKQNLTTPYQREEQNTNEVENTKLVQMAEKATPSNQLVSQHKSLSKTASKALTPPSQKATNTTLPSTSNFNKIAEKAQLKDELLHLPLKEIGLPSKNRLAYQFKEKEPSVVIDPKATKAKKWTAGGGISPGITRMQLKDEFINLNRSNASSHLNVSTLSAELELGYQISKKLFVVSGISYSEWKGNDVTTLAHVEKTKISTGGNNGNDTTNSPNGGLFSYALVTDSLESSITINAFEIPILFRWDLYKRKSSLFMTSGISANWFVNYRNQIANKRSGESYSQQKNGFSSRDAQFNFILSMGVEYPIFKKFEVKFEPHFRYGILNGKDNQFQSPTRGLGFRTGLLYHF